METLDTVGYSEDISLCSWNVLTAALHQRDIYRQLERYVYTSKYQVTFTRLPGTPPIPSTAKTSSISHTALHWTPIKYIVPPYPCCLWRDVGRVEGSRRVRGSRETRYQK